MGGLPSSPYIDMPNSNPISMVSILVLGVILVYHPTRSILFIHYNTNVL